ncbi:MAG: GNAT family N-acetyltransferase [Pseudomonadota bacterium]
MTPVRVCSGDGAARALAAIRRAATGPHQQVWTASAFLQWTQGPPGIVLADPECSRGYIILSVAAEEAEIIDLRVVPAERRRGLAASLLDAGAQIARKQGVHRLTLEVATDNAPALALYHGAGFQNAGRRPGYYRRADGGRVDAHILAKAL